MLENLTGSLSQIIKRVRGHGRLTEDNVRSVAAELHATLLDADVALEVVDDFIGRVKAEAIGKKSCRLHEPPDKLFSASSTAS